MNRVRQPEGDTQLMNHLANNHVETLGERARIPGIDTQVGWVQFTMGGHQALFATALSLLPP